MLFGHADASTVRSLHSTAQLLLTKLQGTIAKASSTDVAMTDASDPLEATQVAIPAPNTARYCCLRREAVSSAHPGFLCVFGTLLL